MNKEPLVTVAAITAIVSALLSVLVAFGIDLTQDQSTAILGAVGVIAPLVVAWVARGKVASPATVEKIEQAQQS